MTETDALELPLMAHGDATCTVKCLWVHVAPNLQAKIIGSLTLAEHVTVWMVEGEWWLVQTDDGPNGSALTGWSHSGYLQPVKELVRGVDGGA